MMPPADKMGKCEKCGDQRGATVGLNGHFFCVACFNLVCKELAQTIRSTFGQTERTEG